MSKFSVLSSDSFEESLAKLRELVVCEVYSLDKVKQLNITPKTANDFIACRTNFNGSMDKLDSFLKNSKNIWNIAKKLPPAHNLYLPPLYMNNERLKRIVSETAIELLKRENLLIYGNESNSGHIVIGGVEGVGKSTISRAIALSCAILLKRMTPIYYFVNEDQRTWITIDHMLRQRFSEVLEGAVDDDDVGAILRCLSAKGIDIVLFMDEFQRFFVKNADNSNLGKRITQQMADASRCCATLGIITGSSVNLRSHLFKSTSPQGEEDEWRSQGYPNFNGTLYRFYFVPALRNIETLRKFLTVRYPTWKLSDEDVRDLLDYTGGIGRFIHEFHLKLEICGALSDMTIAEEKREGKSFRSSLSNFDCKRRFSREELLADNRYRGILTYFAAKQNAAVPKHELVNVLKALFNDIDYNAIRTINTAVDVSVLYEEDSKLQVTIPYDITYLKEAGVLNIPQSIKLTVVSFMVRGIVEGEEVININAGSALESLVRGKVFSLIGENWAKKGEATIELDNNSLQFKIIACESPSLSDKSLPVDISSIDCLKPFFGIALKWRNEIGLDAWTIAQNDHHHDEATYELIGWQCKGGRYNVRVTPGVEATMVKNYCDHQDLSKVDASTIAGISVKAQVGFLKLIAALEKISLRVTKIRLLLTTTKTVTPSSMSICELAFSSDLVKTVLGKKRKLPKIQLTIISGSSWITDCVDSSVDQDFCESMFGRTKEIEQSPIDERSMTNTVASKDVSRCILC
eukprot:scaffold1034_cov175-Ochromonas_danica.AAC.1